MSNKYTSIGGQALIEGIMMRGSKKTALCVRLPDNSISTEYMNFVSVKEKFPVLKLPILRGIVGFIESMLFGYKAMMLSAEKSGFADEVEDDGSVKKQSDTFWSIVSVVAIVLAVILCMGLFIYLPALVFDLLNNLCGGAISGFKSLFEGILKLAVFVGYIAAVSLMKDIKRVFSYHGAEHKTIFCFEKGLPLTVENVKKQRRFHPRCGTSFMILMLLVSILASFLIQSLFPAITANRILWVIIKLLLVPIVCGIGYELIKLCGKYDNLLTRIISAPGVALQHITTKEPEDAMIEVAIAALEAVLEDEDRERFKISENED